VNVDNSIRMLYIFVYKFGFPQAELTDYLPRCVGTQEPYLQISFPMNALDVTYMGSLYFQVFLGNPPS